MQFAIFVVLVLIACILAPWLLWVVAGLVAAFGTVAYAVFVIAAFVLVACLIVFTLRALVVAGKERRSRRSRASYPTEAQASEINRNFLVQADKSRAEKAASISDSPLAESGQKRLKPCPNCGVEIAKYSIFCPACGKDTKGS